MFNRSIRPVLSFYVSDVETAEAALRDADVLWQSLDDRPIYEMTSAVYSEKTHEIFLFLQDHRHILDMEGRFPLSVDIYREMMNVLDEEMRRSYSAGGALVGDICRLLPQFIDALNREIGSSIAQGVRSRSCVFSARHSKTELKRVHHNILGMLDEAVSYVNMHRDSFKPRELMSILSAAPQALAILAEGMRDIDFEVAGELRSIGRHIEDMIADLRSGASDVNLDYLMGDLFDYLDAVDNFRSFITSSRTRFSRSRRLSSGVKDSASIMEFCDYWELERDHRGILMDELDTDDVDEVFPWGMMLEAMNRAKVNRADEWYGGFTDWYDDPVDFSEFIS